MADKLSARQKVIDLARTFAGSHYLWGAAGASPNGQDGSPHRPGRVGMSYISLEPRSPSLNAAECNVEGRYVCAGRYLKAPGGKMVPPTDDDLIDFLACFRKEGWGVYKLGWADDHRSYFLNLTPRVIIGSNIDSKYQGKIVWGEDCRWRRHFDCIGFINYVFNQTTQNPYNPGIPWSANIEQWVNSTSEVSLGDPPVPGDILFRWYIDPATKKKVWHHIALLSENGYVVQAEEAVTGVHSDELYNNGATWKERRRLGGEFFG
jgi:cell wall-associated NlpC family hydrolase